MHDQTQSELQTALASLVGKECWDVGGSHLRSSNLLLDFGRKSRREQPVLNPNLSEEKQLHKGEYSLLIYCEWYLGKGSDYVCDWVGFAEDRSRGEKAVRIVVRRKVENVQTAPPDLRFKLDFEGDFRLEVTPYSEDGPDDGQYIFYTPTCNYEVLGRTGIVDCS